MKYMSILINGIKTKIKTTMNENLNLVEILKDCPKGTKLYSTVSGSVDFDEIENALGFPVKYVKSDGTFGRVTAEGLVCPLYDGECTLFPSKDQRDWSKFKVKSNKPRFNPNTLKPFDKVLARNDREDWSCVFFSHIVKDEETYPYACGYDWFTYCIPYNEDTEHLAGTNKEAPEFYRYWD